jgi:hypothetical protein
MKNNILHIVIFVLIAIILFATLLISPYNYEWEPDLKQINDDSVLVLRFFLILSITLSITGLLISIKRIPKFKYIYIGLILITTYKLLRTFFL